MIIDKRPEELEQISKSVHTLVLLYPELFDMTTYYHPVFGERESLKLKPHNKEIDIEYIRNVIFDYDTMTVKILVIPEKMYEYKIEVV